MYCPLPRMIPRGVYPSDRVPKEKQVDNIYFHISKKCSNYMNQMKISRYCKSWYSHLHYYTIWSIKMSQAQDSAGDAPGPGIVPRCRFRGRKNYGNTTICRSFPTRKLWVFRRSMLVLSFKHI